MNDEQQFFLSVNLKKIVLLQGRRHFVPSHFLGHLYCNFCCHLKVTLQPACNIIESLTMSGCMPAGLMHNESYNLEFALRDLPLVLKFQHCIPSKGKCRSIRNQTNVKRALSKKWVHLRQQKMHFIECANARGKKRQQGKQCSFPASL